MKRVRLKLLDRISFRSIFFSHLIFFNILFLVSSKKTLNKPLNLLSIPKTSFSCRDRPAGYYADPEADCQVYHMCDTLQKQYSYLCPALTLFNQKFMVCDHWYAVDCSIATQFYHLNKKIGIVPDKKSKPESNFVEEREISNRKLTSVSKFNSNKSSTSKSAENKFRASPISTPLIKPRTLITTSIFSKNTQEIKPRFQNPSSKLKPRAFLPKKNFHVNARGSGIKVKFGLHNKSQGVNTVINGLRFRTLFNKPKKSFFDKRNFTVPPSFFSTTVSTLTNEQDVKLKRRDDSNENFNEIKSLTQFLVPPLQETERKSSKAVNLNTLPLNVFLVPPPRKPIVLHGENQEIHTPLSLNNNLFSFSRNKQRISNHRSPRTNVPLTLSAPNREFFISSNGLRSPLPNSNSVSQNRVNHFRNIIPHHMTMTFPTSSVIRRRRPLEINPKCPRCHPAFLRPNKCHPCVIIK